MVSSEDQFLILCTIGGISIILAIILIGFFLWQFTLKKLCSSYSSLKFKHPIDFEHKDPSFYLVKFTKTGHQTGTQEETQQSPPLLICQNSPNQSHNSSDSIYNKITDEIHYEVDMNHSRLPSCSSDYDEIDTKEAASNENVMSRPSFRPFSRFSKLFKKNLSILYQNDENREIIDCDENVEIDGDERTVTYENLQCTESKSTDSFYDDIESVFANQETLVKRERNSFSKDESDYEEIRFFRVKSNQDISVDFKDRNSSISETIYDEVMNVFRGELEQIKAAEQLSYDFFQNSESDSSAYLYPRTQQKTSYL